VARRKYSNCPIIMWRRRGSVNSEFFPADINCSQIASPTRGDLNWFRINRIAWEVGGIFPRKCAVCPTTGRTVNQLHTYHVPLRITSRMWHTCQIIFAARSHCEISRFCQFKRRSLSFLLVVPTFAILLYGNYKWKS